MHRGLAAVAAVAVLLAGACGGKQTAKPAIGDSALAAKIVLKKADLPSGFDAQPHAADPTQAAVIRQLSTCLGIGDPAPHTTALVNSDDFSKGQGVNVSSSARIVKTGDQASADLAGYQSNKATTCMQQALEPVIKERLPSGFTPSNLAVQQLVFPTLKDGTAAHQGSFTIPLAGTNVPVYVDFIIFRAGRAEVTLQTTNAGSPFDTKLEQELANKMADRT
ncbi:MAG: hypothetical protein JO176_08965 [Acidimicrobiia bacterium]|nr:hypothetical protein [Acidimicrobiia bacterium]